MSRAARLLSLLLLALSMAGAGRAQEAAPVRATLMILHDHGNPVTSEMVTLRLRGEYDLTVSLEDMAFPDSADYDWVQLSRDDWHKERVQGELLQVFERRIAVFPRRAGSLRIGPVTHHLTYVTEGGGRGTADVTSAPITLEVKPFPGGYRPLAAARLELTDELSAQPGALKKDEVLIRRVTIEAVGTLAHQLPPRPDLRQPWMISIAAPEVRETTLTEAGPVAKVVWEWQLRPHTGEPAILSGMGFPWFDTSDRQMKVAPLKPIPFGFAGFGTNFAAPTDAGRQSARMAWLWGLAGLAGGIAALALSDGARAPRHGRARPLAGLGHWWRRHGPSPQARALREAARRGDLPAMRHAAKAHLAFRGRAAGGLLDDLDRQIFAAMPDAAFDPADWLATFRRRAGR